MLNFKEIENRIKAHTGLSEGRDIATLFGMSPQSYSNKKGLGTILPTIIEWAIHENVNLDWLLRGEDQTLEPKPVDPQIREVVSIMERLDDKAKADIVRVAEKEELLSDIKKSRGLKPIGEAGIIGLNLLIQLLLPAEIILMAVGLGWISGDDAWCLLHLNIYYWTAAIAAVVVYPAQALRWLKRRELSVVTFGSERFGFW